MFPKLSLGNIFLIRGLIVSIKLYYHDNSCYNTVNNVICWDEILINQYNKTNLLVVFYNRKGKNKGI